MRNFSLFLLTILLIVAFYFSGTLQSKTSNDNLLLIKPSLFSLPFVSPIPTPVTPIVPSLPITRCLQLENHIPTERVVAISSDCHLNDFETQAREIARKYGEPDAVNQFAPPFIPNTAKFYPLRIIGPDDRIKIYYYHFPVDDYC